MSKIDLSKPIEYNWGCKGVWYPARVLSSDLKNDPDTAVLVVEVDGRERVCVIRNDGTVHWVRNKKVKRKVWIHLFKTTQGAVYPSAQVYLDPTEIKDSLPGLNIIHSQQIEYEE